MLASLFSSAGLQWKSEKIGRRKGMVVGGRFHAVFSISAAAERSGEAAEPERRETRPTTSRALRITFSMLFALKNVMSPSMAHSSGETPGFRPCAPFFGILRGSLRSRLAPALADQ